jgi:hypothetical protein
MTYKILSFIANNGDIYTWTGDHTGMFLNAAGNTRLHLFHLLSKPLSYKINTVKFNDNNNFTFKRGRSYYIGYAQTPQVLETIQIFGNGTLMFNIFNGLRLISDTSFISSLSLTPKNFDPQQRAVTTATINRGTVTQTTPANTTTDNEFFTRLQTVILTNNPRAIRVQGLLKKTRGHNSRTETLKEFIVKFFTKWNNDLNTIYVDDSSVQTDPGRRRSLGDLFMIVRYYYPNVTLKELFAVLHDLCTNTRGFRTSRCSTIHKRVWYFSEGEMNAILIGGSNDEYNFNYSNYTTNL